MGRAVLKSVNDVVGYYEEQSQGSTYFSVFEGKNLLFRHHNGNVDTAIDCLQKNLLYYKDSEALLTLKVYDNMTAKRKIDDKSELIFSVQFCLNQPQYESNRYGGYPNRQLEEISEQLKLVVNKVNAMEEEDAESVDGVAGEKITGILPLDNLLMNPKIQDGIAEKFLGFLFPDKPTAMAGVDDAVAKKSVKKKVAVKAVVIDQNTFNADMEALLKNGLTVEHIHTLADVARNDPAGFAGKIKILMSLL